MKSIILIFGFYPKKIWRSLKALPWYRRTQKEFRKQTKELNSQFPITSSYPCLLDKDDEGGSAKGHYFHQDLLVAQEIFKNNPVKHVDIGSRIDGFVGHVATFRTIEVLDIRDITSTIPNVEFLQADCMSPDFKYENYCDSASSLHAIEHFGLGRYGDPIDAMGHLKGLDNIYKMLKRGGTLYFSVPIGPQRVEFNAHRVFSIKYLLQYFKDKYTIEAFSFVDDNLDLHRNIKLTEESIHNNCGCRYGCGIFVLTKP